MIMFPLTYERIICELGFDGEGALCQLTATFTQAHARHQERGWMLLFLRAQLRAPSVFNLHK